MAELRFDDGAAYELMMGTWSRLIGEAFLGWLAPAPNLDWVDVGCGNGAFSELIVARAAAAAVHGVDPSEGQLSYARTRPGAEKMHLRPGHALELPYPDRTFDAAVMALVLFFVPDPAKGVAEMVRVVKPGGSVSAYAWDVLGGGFPQERVFSALREMGRTPVQPPRVDASRLEVMQALWRDAGLTDVETRVIDAERTFTGFDELWAAMMASPTVRASMTGMSAAEGEELEERIRRAYPAAADGTITYSASANAVKGRVAA